MITTQQIETLIRKNVPSNAHVIVKESKWALSGNTCIKIGIAASDYEINSVRGQFPQLVSLALTPETNELEIQVFGGMGGSCLMVKGRGNCPKVAFRKPKAVDKSVLSAIEKFAQRWVVALKENRAELSYQNDVDYDALLSS